MQRNEEDRFFWKKEILVDSTTAFAFSFLSTLSIPVFYRVWDPNGLEYDNNQLMSLQKREFYPVGDYRIPSTSFYFENPVAGRWIVEITSTSVKDLIGIQSETTAVVIVWNYSPNMIFTHLNTYNLVKGQRIGLVTGIKNKDQPHQVLLSRKVHNHHGVVASASMDIILPDGRVMDVKMHDDGLHSDGIADDGVFGATIEASMSGYYRAEAIISGTFPDGTEFTRSTQHVIPVISQLNQLTGKMWTESHALSAQRVKVLMEVNEGTMSISSRRSLRAYAQVWSRTKSEDGFEKWTPICWISSISDVEESNSKYVIPMELDLRWLQRAGISADASLFLREILLQDVNTNIPVMELAEAELDTHATLHHQARLARYTGEIVEEMKVGIRPNLTKLFFDAKFMSEQHPQPKQKLHKVRVALDDDEVSENEELLSQSEQQEQEQQQEDSDIMELKGSSSSTTQKPNLLFVHGYCAQENPWKTHSSYFSNAIYFLDPMQSISNDEFARRLAAFSQAKGLHRFGVIAHSQGGLASTHLLNYYWSALDVSTGPRRIQSVGSPYQGCSGAGSAASIVSLFGFGCGENFDLSMDGIQLWLAGITADTRKEVHYYTSTYPSGGIFSSYCSVATNLLLQWPNDGVTELVNAHLEGANFQGNTEV